MWVEYIGGRWECMGQLWTSWIIAIERSPLPEDNNKNGFNNESSWMIPGTVEP